MATTDKYEVFPTTLKVRNSHSYDANNISLRPIKYALELTVLYLTHTYNLALDHQEFPINMQVANVLLNYRPISSLSVFTKSLETITHSRVVRVLFSYSCLVWL